MVTLSARQIQLSHALGLGPMWVSRDARIVARAAVPNDISVENSDIPVPAIASNTQARTEAVIPRQSQTSAPVAKTHTPATPAEAALPEAVQHKVSKRAAALLAHIAQAQQHRPSNSDSAQASPAEHTMVVQDHSQDTLAGLRSKIVQCSACTLHSERRQAFAGEIRHDCRLIVVLPHPSPQDDAAGALLSGEAGALWLKILKAMHLQADEVYVTNAIKCAPNVSLVPKQHHAAACIGYLERELQLLPSVPVVLLAENQRSLLKKLQAQVGEERVFRIPHPSKMLRNPDTKREAWTVLQEVMQHLPAAQNAAT
ncbi:hypothetical protein LVJ82_07070 [Vitreoscilla massiliensis]|uniref:Uracil-DNA glycosylase-like domain-containing protein n=1 Tax=Vitreoscilla massiliensis TaxID=1689272 RepID=A0ABY4E4P8_9NEIS|nr:uracil-DNA glycosylase family protein [Vitreoscilla massiliensis]UOO90721.1 hypothetical protein LVJ82_07070 [Vitreoscilla massiliensis]